METCRSRYLQHASPSVRIENPPRMITHSFLKRGQRTKLRFELAENRRTVHDYSCLHLFGQIDCLAACLETNTRELVLGFLSELATDRFHQQWMVSRMDRYFRNDSPRAFDNEYVDITGDERLFIQLGKGNQKTYFPKPVVQDVVVYYYVFQQIKTVTFELGTFGQIQSCIRNAVTFLGPKRYPFLPFKVTFVMIPLWQKIVMKEFLFKVWPRQRKRKEMKHLLYGFSKDDLFILRLPKFLLREHILPFV